TYSTYRIVLYQDEQGNLVIIQNPTLWSQPEKSNSAPAQVESNGMVESKTAEEVTEFLETFLSSYPTATDHELAYYVKDHALPLAEPASVISEIVEPVSQQQENRVTVWGTVM